jgi:signal transduction histidine kinase
MEFNILITGITIITILIVTITVCFFFYQKKYYLQVLERNQHLAQFQHELLRAQLEIQEQTLKNISKEIHDNIGQVLSLAKLTLNTMDISNQEATNKISSSKDLVGKAILDLRGLLRNLRSDNIENIGLYRAIEFELEQIKKTELYQTQLKMEGDLPHLDAQKELILFRIVQESLHYIARCGAIKNIKVLLKNSEHNLEVIIDSDRANNEPAINRKNNGTSTYKSYYKMRKRAKIINVDFSLNRKKQSTEVKLVLPLNE